MQIRASETPRFVQCSRYRHAEIQIDTVSEAAEIGTATHKAIELMLDGQTPQDAFAAAVDGLDTSDANLQDVWKMLHTAKAQLDELRSDGGEDGWEVIAERKLAVNFPDGSPVSRLTGTPDVILVSRDRERVIIIDWKTNRDTSSLDSDYAAQLKSYALAWWAKQPKTRYFHLVVSGLRDNVYYMDIVGQSELVTFAKRLLNAAEDETYRIGEHCRYCRAQATCPAILAKTQAAVQTLQRDPATIGELVETGRFADLWELRKVIEKRLEEFKDAARAYIQVNGAIPLPDGKELYLNTIRQKQLDPQRTLLVLRDVEPDELKIAKCFTPSTTRITEVVKDRAREKGEPIGKAVTAFFEAVEAEHEKAGIDMYKEEERLAVHKQKDK